MIAVFLTLFLQILPLLGIVFLGFLGAKKLDISASILGKIILYIINPVVFFYGAYTVESEVSYILLPILYGILASIAGFVFLFLGRLFWNDTSLPHLLGYTAGASNVGFMGLPLVMIFLGEEFFALATMIVMGFSLYENSVGLFIVANGKRSATESISKVLQMPTLYAFIFGLLLNFGEIKLFEALLETTNQFKGAYTVIGMMIIGAGLSTISLSSFSPKLLSLSLLSRLLFWPAITLSLVFLDLYFFNIYEPNIYIVSLFLSLMPLAGSTVAFASEFNLHPEKASIIVFISMVISIFTIPFYWIMISSFVDFI